MPLVAFADYLLDEIEMYAEGLGAFGVRVVPVVGDDATEAATAIRNAHVDAVITRILPEHFGIDLIRVLRADAETASLPALVITSFPQPLLHEHARSAGATEVLLLPQTPEQLARAIHRLIRRAPAA